jgi:hypothetical protein
MKWKILDGSHCKCCFGCELNYMCFTNIVENNKRKMFLKWSVKFKNTRKYIYACRKKTKILVHPSSGNRTQPTYLADARSMHSPKILKIFCPTIVFFHPQLRADYLQHSQEIWSPMIWGAKFIRGPWWNCFNGWKRFFAILFLLWENPLGKENCFRAESNCSNFRKSSKKEKMF